MIHGGFLIIYQWQRKTTKETFKKLGINNNNIILVLIETFITLAIVASGLGVFQIGITSQSS